MASESASAPSPMLAIFYDGVPQVATFGVPLQWGDRQITEED